MNYKICTQCQTENEENFDYCRYCGAPLPCIDKAFPTDTEYFDETAKNADVATPYPEHIYNTSARQLRIFVNKNDAKILTRFHNMEIRNKKSSWSSAVFFLGLFFGFFGISAWFFYRKIYKWGFITSLLGFFSVIFPAIFTSASQFELLAKTAFFYISLVITQSADYLLAFFYQLAYFPAIDIAYIISFILAPLIFAIFAMYIYKCKAVKSINAVNIACTEPELLDIRIASVGGCSLISAMLSAVFAILSFCIAIGVTLI